MCTPLGKPVLTKREQGCRSIFSQFTCAKFELSKFRFKTSRSQPIFFFFVFEAAASESAMDSSSKVLTLTADVRETQKSTWQAGRG